MKSLFSGKVKGHVRVHVSSFKRKEGRRKSYWSLAYTSNQMCSCEHLLPCAVNGLANQAHQSQLPLLAASPVLAENCVTGLRELFSFSVISLSNTFCATAVPWVYSPVFVHLRSIGALATYSVGISAFPVCD